MGIRTLLVYVMLVGVSRADADALKLVPQVYQGAGFARVAADGRYVVRWLDGNRLSLWDHQSGIFLGELAQPDGTRVNCALSPDGRFLAFDAVSAILVQDLDTGQKRRIGPMPNEVTGVWFSRDGTRLFVTHAKNPYRTDRPKQAQALSAWDFATGSKLSEIRTAEDAFAESHFAIGASPNELYWPQTDKITRYDMASGKPVEEIALPVELRGRDIKLAVSADGKRAATLTIHPVGPDHEVVMAYWDWAQHKIVATVQLRAPTRDAFDPFDADRLAISPSGSHVIVRTPKTNIRLFRFGERTAVKELRNEHDVLSFTKDGNHVIVGTGLRNVVTGELVTPETPKLPTFNNMVAIHGTAAYAARDGVVIAWDLDKLERRWVRTEGVAGKPRSATLTADGTKLTVISEHPTVYVNRHVRVFDTATGALLTDEIKRLPFPDRQNHVSPHTEESPDGKWMVAPLPKSRTAELRTLDSGALVQKIQLAHEPFLRAFWWTAHGFVSSAKGTLQFWTMTSDKPVATYAGSGKDHAKIAISPDGNTVGVVDDQLLLQLYDAATARPLRSLSIAKLGYPWQLAIANDRRWAVIVVDGTPMAINLERGTSVRMIDHANQWVIADGDGVFTASAGGGHLLAAVRGRRGFLIDQLALRNNDPAKLMRALDVGSDEQRAYYDHAYRVRLRRAGIATTAVADMFESIPEVRFINVTQSATYAEIALDLEAPRGLLSYNIDVNGVPVFGSRGKPVTGTRQRVSERIQLGRGTNRVELRVIDLAGIEGLRPVQIVETVGTSASDLYFLGFGVSRYANPAYRLEFARKDALDLAAAVQHATPAFSKVHTRVYVDETVTPANIRAAKEFVAKAGVDDVVIVMIAGHGIHSPDGSQYYYVTHGTSIERLAETAAPFEDIEDLLDGIGSRRKLFLMDTCESGERDPGEEAAMVARAGSRGFTPRALKLVGATDKPARPRPFLLERDNFLFNGIVRRSGAVVFSSSRGTELSYETKDLQNGVFTQAVLETFTDAAADLDADGHISVGELRARVAKRVGELTGGAQNPTIDRHNLAADIALPILLAARSIVERDTAPIAEYVVTAKAAPTTAPAHPAARVHSPRGCGCRTDGEGASTALGLAIVGWVCSRRRRRLRR